MFNEDKNATTLKSNYNLFTLTKDDDQDEKDAGDDDSSEKQQQKQK